jgi:SAM-dependent methyltransferase
MIVGEQFVWGHLPKTGGDGTLNFFRLFPELVVHADSEDTNLKHRLLYTLWEEIADKVVALNIRRLPSWTLSYELHKARRGIHPDYEPMPLASVDEMVESGAADEMIQAFTNFGTIKVDRWFRTEYLYQDLLDFVSEFMEIPEDRIEQVARLTPVNTMQYTRDIAEWFTREQIKAMYVNNPLWASVEQEVYRSEIRLEANGKSKITIFIKNVPFVTQEAKDGSKPSVLRQSSVGIGPDNGLVHGPNSSRQAERHMISLLDYSETFDDIVTSRGFVESVRCDDNVFSVKGWMLLRERAFDTVRVFINGEFVGSALVESRQDIANAFPWISHAELSGFRLQKQMTRNITNGCIDVLGYKGNRPVCRMSTLFRVDLDAAVPTPPPELVSKAGPTEDAHLFKMSGLKVYGDLLDAINRYRDFNTIDRMLDWGCGCGRVTVHFLSQHEHLDVLGCDIDPAAIAWCLENLRSGHFSQVEPWPPTPYADGTFDLVVCNSVLTHLTREVQNAWIAEMERIIAPGGLLLTSIYGAYFASFLYPAIFVETPSDRVFHGIFAGGTSSNLEELVPTEYYYPYVVQSREYTIQEWSKYFQILEYSEHGIGGGQDLVVMRRNH